MHRNTYPNEVMDVEKTTIFIFRGNPIIRVGDQKYNCIEYIISKYPRVFLLSSILMVDQNLLPDW